VADYRAYFLNSAGRIRAVVNLTDMTDDEAALRTAEEFLNGEDIEVWQSDRRVATLKHDDS
jgi:hypothetical protein